MSTQQAPTATSGNLPIDRTIFGGQGELPTEASASKVGEELGSEVVPAVTECDAPSSIQHGPSSPIFREVTPEASPSSAVGASGPVRVDANPTVALLNELVPTSPQYPGSSFSDGLGNFAAEAPASAQVPEAGGISTATAPPAGPPVPRSHHTHGSATLGGPGQVPAESRNVGPTATASPTGHSSAPVPQGLRSPTNPESTHRYLKTPTLGQPAGIGGRNHNRSTSSIAQWEPDYQEWPFTMESYCPEIDDGVHIQKAIMSTRVNTIFDDAVESEMLVTEVVEAGGKPDERILCGAALIKHIEVSIADIYHTAPTVRRYLPRQFEHFYLTMHRRNYLPIRTCDFATLAKSLRLPVGLVQCLLRPELQPLHYGSRILCKQPLNTVYDFWYVVRTRVATTCHDMEGMHRGDKSAPGYNQMNPSLLLHLGAQTTDIRVFELFVSFQYNLSTKQTSVLCVNSYRRSVQPINEPQQRLQHALNHAHKVGDRSLMKDPFWVHLIYLGVVLNWWKATLSYFEDELIRHEKIIERRMRLQEENLPDQLGSVPTNRALHAMTAHCLRYGTEILTIIAVIEELITQHSEIGRRAGLTDDDMQRVRRGFEQQRAEGNAILRTQAELAKKTKNTLALLFHSVQAENDGRQVKILEVNQNDVEATLQLAHETKSDSFAMKIVALMTMFFLPATTFSAVLALPYFQDVQTQNTLKLWGIMTGAATVVIFVVFWVFKRMKAKEEERMRLSLNADPEKGSVSGEEKKKV